MLVRKLSTLMLALTALGAIPGAQAKEQFVDLSCSELHPTIESVQSKQALAMYDPVDSTQWFSTSEPPNAIVLLIHGVSMRAHDMNAVVKPLQNAGYSVLRATLAGHGGSALERGKVSRELWLNNALESYCVARARADELHVPLYFVGYSLGALVNLDLMSAGGREKIAYDKMALLAPAVALQGRILALRQFGPLGAVFMRNKANLFRTLLNSYDHLNRAGFDSARIPTLVFLDPKDELISEEKLQKTMSRYSLSSWTLQPVGKLRPAESKEAHHYLISPAALGEAEWSQMIAGMIEFLN